MVIKRATITLVKRSIGGVALLAIFVLMANSWLGLNFLTPHERSLLAIPFVIGACAVFVLSLIERSLVPQAETPRPPQDPQVARRTRRRLVVTGVSLLVASVALPIAGALLFPPAAPGPIGAVSWISAFLMMGGVLCITQSIFLAAKAR